MSFQRDESAKWARAVTKTTREVTEEVKKALEDTAGRGWPEPGGESLGLILDTMAKGKRILTEQAGKIYEEGRKHLFEVEEFELKTAQVLAKLAMELYKARILNAIEIEKAEADQVLDGYKAQLINLDADTELRTAPLIRMKADIEHQVNIYKKQLIQAEYITLQAETDLVNAKLATAIEKLKIIDSIYEVIAAEELVLAAEQRRAASLILVLEAEKRIAAIKREMIPYYEQKANARLALAEATIKEAEIKEDIIRLGYDKIDLKQAEHDADQDIRDAEFELQLANEQLTRASVASELARAEARRLLQEKANDVKREIDLIKAQLAKDGIDLRIETHLARLQMAADDVVELSAFEEDLVRKKAMIEIANLIQVAIDNCQTIRDGAHQEYQTATFTLSARRISKGTASISRPGGSGTIGDAECGQPPE